MAEEKGPIGRFNDKIKSALKAAIMEQEDSGIATARKLGGEPAAALTEEAIKDLNEGHLGKAFVEAVKANNIMDHTQRVAKAEAEEAKRESADVDKAQKWSGGLAAALVKAGYEDNRKGNYGDAVKEVVAADALITLGKLDAAINKVEELFGISSTASKQPDPTRPIITPANAASLEKKGPSIK